MCGIAGWIGGPPASPDVAERMLMAMRHRGPDAQGRQSWPEATLLHARLSIIDLSPAGAQPMCNEDGTVWTVFNGEIYNHRELRRDLEARGHQFRGHSDTEVLPHLWEDEGPALAARLRGMFALAIYDTRSRQLLLVRDRFGIKPLFYAATPDRLAFASEIRALRQMPGLDERPDLQAVHDYAALTYIPAPQTFFRGIRALEPGELLECRLGSQTVAWTARRYHRWSISPDPGRTLEAATDEADGLVMQAVRRQMESDVPLGALLSGGIDSSLVSAAAQAASTDRVRTFNVCFPDKDYDETWAAVAVAEHIGSRHQTLPIEAGKGTWDQIASLLTHAGQPYADTSLFAANAVCRLMRRQVTVALSGDGGDEAFGGYDTFASIERYARWQRLPTPAVRGAARMLAPFASSRLVRGMQRLNEISGADHAAMIQSMLTWVGVEDHRRLCRADGLLPVRRWFEPQWDYNLPARASSLERFSAQTTETWIRLTMPNDFLFKVDTASMRESLEVRVPMLDEDLFDFGLTLPHRLKVKDQVCKRVLREVAARRLPPAVASKPKRGFGIPMDVWADAAFKERLRDTLLGPSSRLDEFFRPEAYRPVIDAFCDGRACFGVSRQTLYQRAIMLLSVQLALSPAKEPALARA